MAKTLLRKAPKIPTVENMKSIMSYVVQIKYVGARRMIKHSRNNIYTIKLLHSEDGFLKGCCAGSLVYIDRRFRDSYCLQHLGDDD